ncbi:CinA family protein [Coxiella-like endosymbiont]|uniref:CinA family protein n=1 Tax=Coxiella-like endosymbiont TaxID=1592897 RepID=UPI00272AEBD8|nr:CinA family protein [Coxiella-like endosymbiont]
MDVNSYPLSRQLGLILKEKGMKLAVAESCTGGGFCRAITRVPGSSVWFECGFIIYSNSAKEELLEIDPQLIKWEGAVSEAVAREMAVGALKRSHADIALSITGIAGPSGGIPDKPVGTIWFGIAKKTAKKTGEVECYKAHFKSGRKHVRDSAIAYGLKCLLKSVTG